jgi:hypothetical protein
MCSPSEDDVLVTFAATRILPLHFVNSFHSHDAAVGFPCADQWSAFPLGGAQRHLGDLAAATVKQGPRRARLGGAV